MMHRFLALTLLSELLLQRRNVFVNAVASDTMDNSLAATSLEQLMTRAYNARVADSTFDDIFLGIEGMLPNSFCRGSVSDWPVPNVEEETDLQRVIDAGVFRCGYVQNQRIASRDGDPDEEVVILQTGSEVNEVEGAVVDWWNSLVSYAATEVDADQGLDVEWILFPSSQDVFDGLAQGAIDAACGPFAPGMICFVEY